MRYLMLSGLMAVVLGGCASNKTSEQPGTRIRDTTMSPADTMGPADTARHTPDSLPTQH